MWQDAHDAYLESRVLSADPIELVRILYQAATGAVRDARRHLAAGQIAARSRAISKAYDILLELTSVLDHERGGEISGRLASLYDYMQRKLIEANLQQSDAPLAEVVGLLATLAEAWDSVQQQIQPPQPPADPWAQPLPQDPAPHYAAQGWSL